MILSRSDLDPSMMFLVSASLIAALLTVRAVVAPHKIGRPPSEEIVEMFGATAAAFVLSARLPHIFVALLPILALFLSVAAVMRYYLHRLSMPGILWVTVQPLALLVSTLWAYCFIVESGFPGWMHAFALAGIAVVVLTF